MKQCNICLEWKNETEFCKRKDTTDGLNYYCKECARQKYLANKEKFKEQAKQNYYKNHDRYLAYDRQRNRTIERVMYRKSYNDKYREEHREQLLEYDRQRNQKTVEKHKLQTG